MPSLRGEVVVIRLDHSVAQLRPALDVDFRPAKVDTFVRIARSLPQEDGCSLDPQPGRREYQAESPP